MDLKIFAMVDQKKTTVELVTIVSGFAEQRIDNFLRNRLKTVPKSLLYRIIRKGEVRVNKKRIKPDYKLQTNDVVRIPPLTIDLKPQANVSTGLASVAQLEQQILFEDSELMVVNKPTGMAVHGGSGLQFGLIEALRALRPKLKQLELVHRLDKGTSGCLLVAKKRSVLRHLHEQLRSKSMQKRYWALVKGHWQAEMRRVEEPLYKNQLNGGERVVKVDRQQGKPALTLMRILERFTTSTLIQASPVTGRTHQIRVHAACKGHPIAGDTKYGCQAFCDDLAQQGLQRMFLHAYSLQFTHPSSGTSMFIEAPLDPMLQNLLVQLREIAR